MAAVTKLNQWRGYCIEHLARAEWSMTQANEILFARPDRVPGKKPSLFGEHFLYLEKSVAIGGPFEKADKLREALERFRTPFEWRNRLVHAHGGVLVDGDQRWTWCYLYHPRNAAAETHYLPASEADELRHKIKRSSHSLKSQIDNFLASLPPCVSDEAKPPKSRQAPSEPLSPDGR